MPIHDWSRAPSGFFHHFHQRWTGEICDSLNAGLLPDGYYALVEQHTVVVQFEIPTRQIPVDTSPA